MIDIRLETKPLPLQKGDLISAIAVSSAIDSHEDLIAGIEVFESWGLICQNKNELPKRWGYLAGNDKIRYQKLHSKKDFPLIIFIKGGWGSARLLEKVQPWKKGWVLGYSDTTSILFSRLSAGFDGCIHGPMITSISKEPNWSKERLKNILFGGPIPDLNGEIWNKGKAKGPLVAGNLTVASNLIGTSHMPDLNGAILVLEDISEEPYKIDRMLTHWRLTGIFNNLAGLCLGKFINCTEQKDIPKNETFQLTDILKDRVKDLNIPILANLPIGHCKGNASLPLGKEAFLDGDKGTLKIISD